MHAGLGASFEAEAGWEVVAGYGDDTAERQAVREALAVVDVTPRGKVDVRGALAGALSVVGDVITARVSDQWALVFTQPGGEEVLLPNIESAAASSAMVTDATHLFAGLALAGPALPEVLSLLTSWDPASLSPGASTGAPIGDVRAVPRRDGARCRRPRGGRARRLARPEGRGVVLRCTRSATSSRGRCGAATISGAPTTS